MSQPPIGDYALVGDCHGAALVSRLGSIDWCCLPRFDAGSCFGRLLGGERAGFCALELPEGWRCLHREYLEGTLVLATTLGNADQEFVVLDCLTMHEGGARRPRHQILRVLEGRRGGARVRVRVVPRFDYGEVRPWLRPHGEGVFTAIGGNDALVVTGDAPLQIVDQHDLEAVVEVRAGERVRLSIEAVRPEDIDVEPPDPVPPDELDARLEETVEWWRRWSAGGSFEGSAAAAVKRSAIVLKALTYAPTGAIVAAPTTSLPETPGGSRNWDYRYSWVRDSTYGVRALAELGHEAEADGFRRFITRSAAGHADDLQIVFGVGGERRLTEFEHPFLDGYRRSRPVRIGNAAAEQLQLDVLGELVNHVWRWHRRGNRLDEDQWRFLRDVVDAAASRWREPDSGLWESRGDPRHFVHSKAACWCALDRGLRLAEELDGEAPLDRWRRERDELRTAIEERGVDRRRGNFVGEFDSEQIDAGLLLLPVMGFVAFDDPRMVATVDAVREDLGHDGLLRRYRGGDGPDGEEGAFLACSFWLVECLAEQGRHDEAREVFDRAAATANDVGLFSEEYDAKRDELLGNFPQALTHLSHIAAAVALSRPAQR